MNQAIETLENDIRFSEYRISILLRAHDSLKIVETLCERILRDKAMLAYMRRVEAR